MAIKVPDKFRPSDYGIVLSIPKPDMECRKNEDGSFDLRAVYNYDGISGIVREAAREICDKMESELIDELLRMNGYVPERTCHKELMITENYTGTEVEYFGCSECGQWLSETDCYGLGDGPNYCENCGCKVDKSFVTDEATGEVIYRDGAKVVE